MIKFELPKQLQISIFKKENYDTKSNNSKYLSRLIPAVVKLVRICATGAFLGLDFMTKGLLTPGLVIIIWSPFFRCTSNPSSSNILMSFS